MVHSEGASHQRHFLSCSTSPLATFTYDVGRVIGITTTKFHPDFEVQEFVPKTQPALPKSAADENNNLVPHGVVAEVSPKASDPVTCFCGR